MNLQLNDKLALVTGSTAGIGRAICEALLREGARVIVNGRTQASVDEAVAALRSDFGDHVQPFAGDLSTAAAAQALVERFPDVEILVNNLGIFEPKPFEEIPDADWQRFFNVNVLSGVRLARLFLAGMKRRNWGRIIFISSESGIQIPAEMIHYGMTKAAQLAVSRGLAESVAGTAITVNSVLPGPTRSRGVEEFVGALAREQGKPSSSSRPSSSSGSGRRRSSSDSRRRRKWPRSSPMSPARSRRPQPARRCASMEAWSRARSRDVFCRSKVKSQRSNGARVAST